MKLKYVDSAAITLIAGKGGNGCASFNRERYKEFGGPDGGDGGCGGDIFFESSRNVNTLAFFRFNSIYRAGNGKNGMSKQMSGACGESLRLIVPLGTQILFFDENGEEYQVCDLTEHGQQFLAAAGGFGGLGNIHFKSSVNRRPVTFTQGQPGEQRRIKLSLRTISDVGIIGYPNCGKSSLINTISNVKSKVADYEFTTVKPNVGIINDEINSYIIADIPGLIEGANEGMGLGHVFLRHIEKCELLLHVIDASSDDVTQKYLSIRHELKEYDKKYNSLIALKPEIIVLNKTDLITEEEVADKSESLKSFAEVVAVSAKDGLNIKRMIDVIHNTLTELRPPKPAYYPESGY